MSRRVTTYLTNTHPEGRTCAICHEPIVTGQGAYVRQDGKGATHTACPIRKDH